MTENESALAFLRRLDDPALYEQMAQTLLRGVGSVAGRSEDALLIHNRAGNAYMIAARSREAALSLCGAIPPSARDIVLHGGDIDTAQAIADRFHIRHALRFVLYAYYGACPPPQDGLDIRVLREEDVDFLHAHYAHSGRAYLERRVKDGVMLGAYVGGALAGFIGEHSEGAVGLLHVLPEYRRMGLGLALARAAMRRTMLQGYVPFDQVVPDNEASHCLQARLGFTRAKGPCYWLTDDDF